MLRTNDEYYLQENNKDVKYFFFEFITNELVDFGVSVNATFLFRTIIFILFSIESKNGK